mmetsp:Transcript_12813/g.26162  ORF Transcript_12813/g.26162 Transcript_12813/m.26162 type:complete len:233 (-) Transcript_12813:542-1240(-)
MMHHRSSALLVWLLGGSSKTRCYCSGNSRRKRKQIHSHGTAAGNMGTHSTTKSKSGTGEAQGTLSGVQPHRTEREIRRLSKLVQCLRQELKFVETKLRVSEFQRAQLASLLQSKNSPEPERACSQQPRTNTESKAGIAVARKLMQSITSENGLQPHTDSIETNSLKSEDIETLNNANHEDWPRLCATVESNKLCNTASRRALSMESSADSEEAASLANLSRVSSVDFVLSDR